jgi:hypothetical protein
LAWKKGIHRMDELAEWHRKLKEHRRKIGWRAIRTGTVPRTIPKREVLVHNQVRPVGMFDETPVGPSGFRAWTQKRTGELRVCKCGWSGLPHYRMKFVKWYTPVEPTAAIAELRRRFPRRNKGWVHRRYLELFEMARPTERA